MIWGQPEIAKASWEQSAALFDQLNRPFDSYLVRTKYQTQADRSQSGLISEPLSSTGTDFRGQLLNIVEDAWIEIQLSWFESVGQGLVVRLGLLSCELRYRRQNRLLSRICRSAYPPSDLLDLLH